MWEIPYLPLDPQDIGRSYEAVIRVNSQSGKGGAAWVIQRRLELDLPRGLQVAFSKVVQKEAERLGRELLSNEITDLFVDAYHLKSQPRFTLVDYDIVPDRASSPAPPETGKSQNTKDLRRCFKGIISIDGEERKVKGVGNGPISSLANALSSQGIDIDVTHHHQHAIGEGSEVKAATFIECRADFGGNGEKVWGVGIHQDATQANLLALLGAASSVRIENHLRQPGRLHSGRPSVSSLIHSQS